jgi:UDP-glucose 4-epimerase
VRLVAGCDRAHSILKWQPRFDDLGTIITHALAWERKLQSLPAASEFVDRT